MRTKTKSFFEDLFIIFIIGLIIYGIYSFFFSSSENELTLDEMKNSVEKKIENEILVKSPIPEQKSNEKVAEEKIEETIKQTQQEVTPIATPTNIEEKIENRNEKPKEIIQKIETTPILEKIPSKEDIKTKEKEVAPTTEVSQTQEEDKAKIELFYEQIRAQINSNIDKSLIKNKEAVSIRLTILKDGRYEQISLTEGNKENFELIRSSITKAFPVKIDDNLKANFPRYFRMKIEF